MTNPLIKYRPEVDGLRAVAVLPVILFHAGFEFFSGGFIGGASLIAEQVARVLAEEKIVSELHERDN